MAIRIAIAANAAFSDSVYGAEGLAAAERFAENNDNYRVHMLEDLSDAIKEVKIRNEMLNYRPYTCSLDDVTNYAMRNVFTHMLGEDDGRYNEEDLTMDNFTPEMAQKLAQRVVVDGKPYSEQIGAEITEKNMEYVLQSMSVLVSMSLLDSKSLLDNKSLLESKSSDNKFEPVPCVGLIDKTNRPIELTYDPYSYYRDRESIKNRDLERPSFLTIKKLINKLTGSFAEEISDYNERIEKQQMELNQLDEQYETVMNRVNRSYEMAEAQSQAMINNARTVDEDVKDIQRSLGKEDYKLADTHVKKAPQAAKEKNGPSMGGH